MSDRLLPAVWMQRHRPDLTRRDESLPARISDPLSAAYEHALATVLYTLDAYRADESDSRRKKLLTMMRAQCRWLEEMRAMGAYYDDGRSVEQQVRDHAVVVARRDLSEGLSERHVARVVANVLAPLPLTVERREEVLAWVMRQAQQPVTAEGGEA